MYAHLLASCPICHFTHLVPVHTTHWFVVSWCFPLFFPSRYFCLRYSLSNLSPPFWPIHHPSFYLDNGSDARFGLPLCISLSKELSLHLHLFCWTRKLILNTFFFPIGHRMRGNTLVLSHVKQFLPYVSSDQCSRIDFAKGHNFVFKTIYSNYSWSLNLQSLTSNQTTVAEETPFNKHSFK